MTVFEARRRAIRGVMILLLAGFGSGCATMFSGSTQQLQVQVSPPDAQLTVDGQPRSVGVLELERGKTHTLEASKEGLGTRRVMVAQSLNGWFFANLLWGPGFWIGMLVDAMTGSIHELSPSQLTLALDASTGSSGGSVAGSSSGSSFAVTFVSPGGPSLDPLSNARGTGISSRSTSNSGASAATVHGATSTSNSAQSPATPTTSPSSGSAGSGSAGSAGSTGSTGSGALAVSSRPASARIPRTLANGEQREWVLAVMNTQVAGRSKALTRDIQSALTDQIRVFLAERGLRVIDRGSQEAAMNAIVQDEKAKSYKTCVDESCQIPLGKALAASHIMKSTVAVFGKACTTNGELIDLRSEVTIAAGSARSGCEAEDLLVGAEQLAEELVVSSSRKHP
ncbi:MAG: hypothetical protein IPK13_06200 [Deltaproteobacteria bacterium]|nr:hypothetical protein [Deltaproteobacteria bacterium]